MITKICKECKIEKCLKEFCKHPTCKFGKNNKCKSCDSDYSKKHYQKNKVSINKRNVIYNKKYRKDIKPWFTSFDKAKQRCNNPNNTAYKYYGGRGIKFLMVLGDFENLWFRDKAYEMDRPSIDRIDSNGNYEINNCQFIELSENSAKDSTKSIIQYTKENKFIRNWDSIKDASSSLKIDRSSISRCCYGEAKTAGGFKWQYKLEVRNG